MSDVIIYTKPDCRWCEITKRRLDAYGLSYTEIDVEQDTEAYAKITDEWGFKVVPVVETPFDVWSDYNEDKIRQTKEDYDTEREEASSIFDF